jgi:hypothetical protein
LKAVLFAAEPLNSSRTSELVLKTGIKLGASRLQPAGIRIDGDESVL